jgi:hypothetical protein
MPPAPPTITRVILVLNTIVSYTSAGCTVDRLINRECADWVSIWDTNNKWSLWDHLGLLLGFRLSVGVAHNCLTT